MKKSHHWILITIVIVIAWHYRMQLLALWNTRIAPVVGSVLPASVASLLSSGAHPLDVPPSARAINPLGILPEPKDVAGIKSVIGDVNDNTFVGRDTFRLFRDLGGIDYGGFGNPNPQAGTGGPPGGAEHFV